MKYYKYDSKVSW